jgi:uncharacterized protein with HEPN domain
LEDINEALELSEEYVINLDFTSWTKDRKTIDVIIRNLEIIGEAAHHIPDSIQEKYSKIHLSPMIGFHVHPD